MTARHPDYVDNFAEVPEALRAEAIDGMAKQVARYGMPPVADAALVAAHEAGHIVVGRALGRATRWRRASIFAAHDARGDMGGSNFIAEDEKRRPRRAPTARTMLAEAAYAEGGILGEIFVGGFHPCSSLDEQWIAAVKSGQVALLAAGLPLVNAVDGYAMDLRGIAEDRRIAVSEVAPKLVYAIGALAINDNRETFEALADLLLRRRRVGWSEMRPFVDAVRPVDKEKIERTLKVMANLVHGGAR